MQQFQAFEKALESVGPGGDDGIWDGEEEDDDEGFDGHASHSEEAPAASGGGEGGSDGEEGSLAEELDLFTKKLSSYIQRTRLDEDDVSELRALTMMTGRSMQRRADGGMYDNGGVREALRGQLFAQIVEREGLVSEEDWAAIITSKVSPLSSSKPQGGAAKTAAANPAALLLELKGMFPGAPPSMLLSAAKGAKSLVSPLPRPLYLSFSLTLTPPVCCARAESCQLRRPPALLLPMSRHLSPSDAAYPRPPGRGGCEAVGPGPALGRQDAICRRAPVGACREGPCGAVGGTGAQARGTHR